MSAPRGRSRAAWLALLALAVSGTLCVGAPVQAAWAGPVDSSGPGSSAAGSDESATGVDQEAVDAAVQALEREIAGRLGGDRGILPSGIDSESVVYVGIARLAGADESLDGTLVSFRGEVVGEPVRSSMAGRVWITMQSNSVTTSSIGVLMDEEQVALIEHFGAHGVKGTTLLVTGIYRVADVNQGGSIDVVAYAVRAVEEGAVLGERFSSKKLWLAIALTSLGLAFIAVNLYRRKRIRT